MIKYTTTIKRFSRQGEKTGWTYIEVPEERALELYPGNKKSFRVKGKLDRFAIEGIALLPMGDGSFILPMNAGMRKGTGKQKGDPIVVQLAIDRKEITAPADLMECLQDEPEALLFFQSLTKGHQNYFTKWIESAKTEPTRAKRIAQTVNGLLRKKDFGTILREGKREEGR